MDEDRGDLLPRAGSVPRPRPVFGALAESEGSSEEVEVCHGGIFSFDEPFLDDAGP